MYPKVNFELSMIWFKILNIELNVVTENIFAHLFPEKVQVWRIKKRLKWIRTCNYIVSVFAVFSILTLCLAVLVKQPDRSWSTDKSEN